MEKEKEMIKQKVSEQKTGREVLEQKENVTEQKIGNKTTQTNKITQTNKMTNKIT